MDLRDAKQLCETQADGSDAISIDLDIRTPLTCYSPTKGWPIQH